MIYKTTEQEEQDKQELLSCLKENRCNELSFRINEYLVNKEDIPVGIALEFNKLCEEIK